MHAVLPRSLLAQEIKKRIEDMEEGEKGSGMPYAMAADSEDHLWLDPGALITLNEQGDFCVKMTRDGYEVEVNSGSSYKWERGEVDNNGNLNQYTLPVAKIKVLCHNTDVSKNGHVLV